MTIDRERLYAKVRALLAKTQENGCTEAEAMAALAKARAMMDAYEITDEELQLTKAEAAIIHTSASKHDKYGVRRWLGPGVAKYCACKAWTNRDGDIVFCGLPSDAQLADWLLGSLEAFVRRELAAFLLVDLSPRGMRRRVINGFVLGCSGRIVDRLFALVAEAAAAKQSNSKALVLIKDRAIDDAIAAAGIKLRARTAHRVQDNRAHKAGATAGDRATFGRPVGFGGQRLIGR